MAKLQKAVAHLFAVHVDVKSMVSALYSSDNSLEYIALTIDSLLYLTTLPSVIGDGDFNYSEHIKMLTASPAL